jgi:hypothetical protein
MVNVLYVEGNTRGSHQLEQFFDEVAHEETVAIFCSFLMDKYDPHIYDEAFANVCRTHSNVIPTADYAGHYNAVNCAVSEVIGPIRGRLLHSLMAWSGERTGMPTSQALLLWVKDTMPQRFPDVLARAREHDRAAPETHR